MEKGLLVVISGFSGVGKGTVVNYMLKANPDLNYSVSCTSRKPRDGEVDGKSYYFLTEEEFEKKIANNEFAEYTKTFTNYYGTLKSELDKSINNGKDIILEINVVGGNNIKKVYPNCLSIFIAPPSMEELEHRLLGRGSETEETIKLRMGEISFEIEQSKSYDKTFKNVVVEDCANEILEFIKQKHIEYNTKMEEQKL